jgi:hypothetical protein
MLLLNDGCREEYLCAFLATLASGRTLSFVSLGLVGYIGLSFIGLSGLSGISGLIGQISLINLSASWNHGPIGIIGVVGFGHIIASVSSARRFINLVGLAGLLTHWPFLDSLATALIAAKTKISRWLKQAAALGVATVRSSATEIANAASIDYLITSLFHVHSLVREKMWWWLALARKKLCWWLVSFGESYHGDVLQYAKHLFSLRLPQMTKYCVMRECDNIHSWIS